MRGRFLLLVIASLGLAACTGGSSSGSSYPFNNDPQGPGLFTGKAGEFVIPLPSTPAPAKPAEPGQP